MKRRDFGRLLGTVPLVGALDPLSRVEPALRTLPIPSGLEPRIRLGGTAEYLPFDRQQRVIHIDRQPETFVCPTLCGCVVTEWRDFVFVPPPRFQALSTAMRAAVVQHANAVVHTPAEVHAQCEGHRHLATPRALWDELYHFHGNAHRPGCGCSLSYWFDDRVPQELREHQAVEHPIHTKRCTRHAHLTDHVEHYKTVLAENVRKTATVPA